MDHKHTRHDEEVEKLRRRVAELETERTAARPGVAIAVGRRHEMSNAAAPMANVRGGATIGATVDATMLDFARAQVAGLGRVAPPQNVGVSVSRVLAKPAPHAPQQSPLANSTPVNLFANLDKI